MDSFAAYGSDSDDSEAPDTGGETTTTASAAAPAPAWQQAEDSDDGDEDESEGKGGHPENDSEDKRRCHAEDDSEAKRRSDAAEVAAPKETEPKKRKLLNPFAALQQGKPSFLAAGEPNEPEFFQRYDDKGPDEKPAQRDKETEQGHVGGTEGSAPAASVLPPAQTGVAAQSQSKKEETTRQKNSRKQKLGQANFTVKSNRECPDIWQGGS